MVDISQISLVEAVLKLKYWQAVFWHVRLPRITVVAWKAPYIHTNEALSHS
jgi:hypothetical protein